MPGRSLQALKDFLRNNDATNIAPTPGVIFSASGGTTSSCVGELTVDEEEDGDKTDVEETVVELDSKELWDKFHSMETEMVITKSGR